MKLAILSLLSLLALFNAHAAPLEPEKIAGMASQIDAVMNTQLCQVANDERSYPGEFVAVLLPPPVGLRRIPRDDYNWMRNTGYARTATGWLMTARMREACSADGDSGRCIAFRSYFSQFPVAVRAPGAGVPTR